MQEKFGVELEAITSKFKAKMEEAKQFAQKTSDKIKQTFSQIKITPKVETLDFSRIENATKGLKNALESSKIMDASDVGTLDVFGKRLVNANGEIKILRNNLSLMKPPIVDATNEMENFTKEEKKANKESNSFKDIFKGVKQVDKGLKQMIHRVSRYALAILSVRTAFSLVSRASQAYLQYDTDLANKLQGVWAALGAFLAPIIEKIANALMRLVGYLNVFIKAVTTQDLLAKASAKATKKIKEQTKATKGLNKSLTDLDEITNIMDETGSGSGTEPIENPFKNIGDVKLNTDWADRIERFGKWFKENWPYVIAGIVGLSTVLKGLEFILQGGTFATFGKVLLGVGLIVLGVAEFFYSLKEYIDDVKKRIEDSKKGWLDFGGVLAGIAAVVAGIGLLIGATPVVIAGAIVAILALLAAFWPQVKEAVLKFGDWILNFNKWLFGDTIGDIITAPFLDAVDMILDLFDGLFKGIKDIVTGIIKIFQGDVKVGFIKIGKGLGNVLIGAINSLIGSINFMLAPMRGIIVGLGNIMGQKITMKDIKIPKIPLLDSGTGYVPEDQMAYIHKGEAVIPKKFNSAEYFSNINNNEETNSLLLEANRTLIDILEKDNSFYVNGKELARTTYNDFQQEGNRINKNNIVKVG